MTNFFPYKYELGNIKRMYNYLQELKLKCLNIKKEAGLSLKLRKQKV